jgi:hypothetical protein
MLFCFSRHNVKPRVVGMCFLFVDALNALITPVEKIVAAVSVTIVE